ncbi:hypothetical protein AB0O07_25990 [Streptomyces sp. NPDC093085]|uniref:hypothetical protein n=1 Tax=Streptomyces sp. NPDC093085 TaxID=3155068 RepID=UPI00341DFEBB
MTGHSDTEFGADDARTVLVARLHAAWARSGLKQQSVETRLKAMLSGQNVRGLSDTALSRYLKPDGTALPAGAVLTALAQIFGVGEKELAHWHELRRRAKADQRRLRYQRRTPPPGPAEESAAGGGDQAGEVSVTPDGAGESGREARRERTEWRAKAVSGALAGLVAGGMLTGALILGVVLWGRGVPEDAGAVGGGPDPGSRGSGEPVDGPVTGGLEKGSLGEDSRCSVPFQGPDAVVWRVCARVEEDRVSFALKITNEGLAAVTVKVAQQYARESTFRACPRTSGFRRVEVPGSGTVTTDPALCALPRQDVPVGYQGVGWVIAEHDNGGTYRLSPTASVSPDRVIWTPDLV